MMSKKKDSAPKNENYLEQDERVIAETIAEEILKSIENNGETAPDSSSAISNKEHNIQLQEQLDELKDKYMRLYAEFENFKKRSVREKIDWMKTAAQDTLTALLPVLDDFDRAKKFAQENSETGFSEGVDLVYQKLYMTLKSKGLEPMESNGQAFDPELHDAISEIPIPDNKLKGKVIDTVEKGYRLNDKIIRHAKVVVGK